MTSIKDSGTPVFSMVNGMIIGPGKNGRIYGRYCPKKKRMAIVIKVEQLLTELTNQYTPEKTEDDYAQILQGLTTDSELIDMTLKVWAKALIEYEQGK